MPSIALRVAPLMQRTLVTAALLLALSAASGSAQSSSTPADSVRNAADGVYSGDQAAKGEAVFAGICGSCHGITEFSGPAFRRSWAGRTVYDMFDQLRATMPLDNPGGLSREQYAAVIAYLMSVNRYPAADVDLPSADADLRRVRFDP